MLGVTPRKKGYGTCLILLNLDLDFLTLMAGIYFRIFMRVSYSSLMKAKKILITGATGFIGRHLLCYLNEEKYFIRLFVRGEKSAESHVSPNMEICLGDLSDKASIADACEGIDVVIHLAGLAHANNPDHSSLEEINVRGTETLLSIAIEKRVRRFIFLSSSLAANPDNKALNQIGYGMAKLKSEEAILDAHEDGRIEGIILRPVNVYGLGMRGNVASMIAMIQKGMMPPLPRLDTKISLIGVKDVCQAVALAIESDEARGKVYSLTDGNQYSVSEIEKNIYEVLGRKMPQWKTSRVVIYLALNITGVIGRLLGILGIRIPIISDISFRTYDNLVKDNLFDNSLACAELGFKPTTTFFNSLKSILSDHT